MYFLDSSQEMQVEELSAVRQTLQADLETSIRRIADLQAALEEVESSDESDTERYDLPRVSVGSLTEIGFFLINNKYNFLYLVIINLLLPAMALPTLSLTHSVTHSLSFLLHSVQTAVESFSRKREMYAFPCPPLVLSPVLLVLGLMA